MRALLDHPAKWVTIVEATETFRPPRNKRIAEGNLVTRPQFLLRRNKKLY